MGDCVPFLGNLPEHERNNHLVHQRPTLARIPVEAHYASEFRYRDAALRAGDVVFVVSMSGETTDAVESLRKAGHGCVCVCACGCVFLRVPFGVVQGKAKGYVPGSVQTCVMGGVNLVLGSFSVMLL